MTSTILTLKIGMEQDIVLARQRARQIASLLGFDQQTQIKVATAVSEITRNAFQYAGGGKVEFLLDTAAGLLTLRISDQGQGIANLPDVLGGRYESRTGMGLGIIGARRLMDAFDIKSSPKGTTVEFGRVLPKRLQPWGPEVAAQVAAELSRQRPSDPFEEMQTQNQELLRTLEEVSRQREELATVNRELEETNRGVVALYAEIDERADYLQRANDVKTKFLANMTHEFRTPLNSIIGLTQLLLQRYDGDLSAEQEKQVRYITKSAEDLSEMVNDLLDLAKVEAGKVSVRPGPFSPEKLFAALRGMLRPLLQQNTTINLVFDDVSRLPDMVTDELKVSQILRNFISNALKYTERGEVRVSARMDAGNTVVFSVSDTGIGIAEKDLERIFDEFTQIESPLQRRTRGTGLGLPLTRRLAGLLGGSVRVVSEVGRGSTFYAIIPAEFKGPTEVTMNIGAPREVDPRRQPVLVVEDNREALFIYEKYLEGSEYQVLPARTLAEARQWLQQVRPVAVILDVLLESESSWGFVGEIREHPKGGDVPILVVTMVENEKQAHALGADAFHAKPVDRDWLLSTLKRLTQQREVQNLLLIDDDEVSRYLMRGLLADTRYGILEAPGGVEGVERARDAHPQAIILDVVMPDMDGFTVLESLKNDPDLNSIPVIIYTSKLLSDYERARLQKAAAIIPKDSPNRDVARATIRDALTAAGLTP